jgi:hypothetical protein
MVQINGKAKNKQALLRMNAEKGVVIERSRSVAN